MQLSWLEIPVVHQNLIRTHVDTHPATEVCGLIGGLWQPYPRLARAFQVVPIANIDPHPAVRYTMDPQAQIEAILAFDQRGWDVVGIYHSHPHGTPIPSATDLAEANYPDAVYVIGVPHGALRAWRIIRGAAHPAELHVVG
ncbi:MAG: M67 family metallopeptidase [Anaerolineae bacterium]|nr:M67 family metallopeptidase [Anaerolineae bacterium]